MSDAKAGATQGGTLKVIMSRVSFVMHSFTTAEVDSSSCQRIDDWVWVVSTLLLQDSRFGGT